MRAVAILVAVMAFSSDLQARFAESLLCGLKLKYLAHRSEPEPQTTDVEDPENILEADEHTFDPLQAFSIYQNLPDLLDQVEELRKPDEPYFIGFAFVEMEQQNQVLFWDNSNGYYKGGHESGIPAGTLDHNFVTRIIQTVFPKATVYFSSILTYDPVSTTIPRLSLPPPRSISIKKLITPRHLEFLLHHLERAKLAISEETEISLGWAGFRLKAREAVHFHLKDLRRIAFNVKDAVSVIGRTASDENIQSQLRY